MQTYKKYLIYLGVFIIFVLLGFGVTKMILSDNMEDRTIISSPKPDGPDNNGGSEQESDTVVSPEPEPEPIKIVVVKQQLEGSVYTLEVLAENLPLEKIPIYILDPIGLKSKSGKFSNIKGSKSGKYTVRVVDKSTGEELGSLEIGGFDVIEDKTETIEKMTASAFQSLLLNQNDNSLLGGKNPKVARSVAIRTQGLQEGERVPGDIQAIRDKIANGIWISARVVTVGYDSTGKINTVTIQPVYPQ